MNDGDIMQGVHQTSDADMLRTEDKDDKDSSGRVFQIQGYFTIVHTLPSEHRMTT